MDVCLFVFTINRFKGLVTSSKKEKENENSQKIKQLLIISCSPVPEVLHFVHSSFIL